MKRLDVAIIMDGNRRWAKSNNKPTNEGHKRGAEKLKEVLEWTKEKNCNSLTIYAFSTENFKRSEEEKEALFNLFRKFFKEIEEKGIKDNLKIKFLGTFSQFPKDIQEIITSIETQTKENTEYTLQICFGYGGKAEILSAVKKLVQEGIDPEAITEEVFEEHLYTAIKPDIVIRTGGAIRQSNFLPWQTTYSEWFYVNTFWPDFSKDEYDTIFSQYIERQRRFGV